jgi:hypothetical protein
LIASARRLQNQQLRAAIITDIKILHVRKIALAYGGIQKPFAAVASRRHALHIPPDFRFGYSR